MNNITKHGLDESGPIPQIARFDSWADLRNFEMAYIPSENDYLKWSLTDSYKPLPYDVPYINGINGPLYGRNVIPIRNGSIQCNPFVNSCTRQKYTS